MSQTLDPKFALARGDLDPQDLPMSEADVEQSLGGSSSGNAADDDDVPCSPAAPSEARSKPSSTQKPSQKSLQAGYRAKRKAMELIAKHGGPNWKEASRIKPIVDMVTAIADEYAQRMAPQEQMTAELRAELQSTKASLGAEVQRYKEQARQAAAQLAALQQQVAASQAADRVALEGWSAMEAELGQARATAEVASAECARLTQALRHVWEHDAQSRKALAHRAHTLKACLLQSNAVLRQAKQGERAARSEALLAARDAKAALAAERQQLQQRAAAVLSHQRDYEVLQLSRAAAVQEAERMHKELMKMSLGTGGGATAVMAGTTTATTAK